MHCILSTAPVCDRGGMEPNLSWHALNCQTGMLQMFFILNGVTAAGLALKVNARDTSSRRGGACTGFSKHADPNYYPEQN